MKKKIFLDRSCSRSIIALVNQSINEVTLLNLQQVCYMTEHCFSFLLNKNLASQSLQENLKINSLFQLMNTFESRNFFLKKKINSYLLQRIIHSFLQILKFKPSGITYRFCFYDFYFINHRSVKRCYT